MNSVFCDMIYVFYDMIMGFSDMKLVSSDIKSGLSDMKWFCLRHEIIFGDMKFYFL